MHHTIINFALAGILCFFSCSVFAQPSADFEANKTFGCEPLTVLFNDLSTSPNSALSTWMWEANGSFFSSAQNPAFLLNNPGFYSICLTVTNQNGETNKSCKNDYIQVFRKPVANYTATNREGCAPLAVEFRSTATSADGQITEWIWDLGGPCGIVPGNSNSEVSCTYTVADTYKTTLIVRDDNGCENSTTKEDFITVFPDPDIQVGTNLTFACQAPFTVNFSNDNLESGTTYQWDFGNGQTFSGPNPPAVNYTETGTYTVVVNAVNSTGCTKTLVLEDYIKIGFEVDFSFNSDSGCGDLNINFFDNSPDGATAVLYDFGDGNTSVFSNPNHSYAAPGCYDVTLTRTVNGCSNSVTQLLCITDAEDMQVAMNVQNRLGCELPHTVNFEGVSPVAKTWLWDFGDGTSSTEQNPSHTYTQFGTFPVSLTITDAFGCTKTISTETVEIEAMEIFIANSPLLGCLPLSFTLTDSVESIVPIVSWNWTVTDINNVVVFTSTQEQPNGMINQSGCFNVELEVVNSLGCTATKVFPSAICGGVRPTADFVASPLQACAYQSITFNDLSDASVNSWAWDFNGDGVFDSFESDPLYTYQDTGCFTVTLLVGSNGCFDQITFTDYVCILPPVAKFRVNNNCDFPFDRTFVDESIGADSVSWDFGVLGSTTDTSSLSNPSFTFPVKDTFIVTQIVFNFQAGCSDTLQREIIITQPEASFTLTSDMGCAPMSLEIQNTSIDADRYRWIAPGATSNPSTRTPVITYPDAGQYALQLNIRDINNCLDTFVYDPIFVNELTADFESLQLTDCLPVDVQFNDNSTNLYATNIQWDWLFGDTIGVASGEDIVYSFDQAGFITTQLVITDSWGCKDSIFRDEGININAPFADFIVDSFSCPDLDLQFANTSMGTGLTYSWDFGDGATSNLENPSHQYGLGIYQASLTITSPNCTHTYSQEIIVESVTADFTIDPDYPPCPPASVNFNNMSINASDYFWLFGDDGGGSDQPSHIYTEKGVFDVMLIAIGANPDCRDTMSLDSLVFIQGPSGSFSFEVENNCIPAEITLIGESDRPYNYTWFLDDGNTILSAETQMDTITYTYLETAPNGFVPKLLLASTCDTILISPDTVFVTDLMVDFVASDTFLCDGESMVAFESLVETNAADYQVEWSFDGGMPVASTMPDVAIEYTAPGLYDVSLAVQSDDCLDTLSKLAYIEVVDAISLMAEDQIICEGDSVQLLAESNASEFLWTPATDISDPFIADPLVYPNTSIDYIVTGNYRSCTTARDTVSVEVLPKPEVIYTPVRRYFPGQTIELEVRPKDGQSDYQYHWAPSTGLSCINCPNPTTTPDTSMTYLITITNPETGCISEVIMSVRELLNCPEDLIFIPNAFSPNADGFNDEFKMYSSTIFELDYLRVYDRWGALMWQGNSIEEGWDGTYKGQPVNPGVYVYSLEAPCSINDKVILKKGSITVVR